jgi:protease IV
MKLGVLVAACAALIACKGNDKDKPEPWGNAGKAAGAEEEGGGGLGLGGLGAMGDPMEMLKNVAENLGKPGPYEAPESSPDFAADAPHWAVLHLGGDIIELESLDLLSPTSGTQLRVLTTRLRDLAADPNVTGVLLRVDGLGVSLPDAQELRLALADVRAKGKKLACHTETAANAEYLVLAACEQIGLSPLGDVIVSGPAAMPVHLKGLLAKLGIQADFLHVGAYKGAAEPLTRDAPSDEMKETIGAILDRAYATMVDTIAKDRGLSPDAVEGLIDEALFSAEAAKQAKLVDEIATFEQFRQQVTGGAAWTRLQVEPKDDPMASMFKLARFFGVMPAGRPRGAHLAVVHAVGNVIDGNGGGTLGARGEIASATLVSALRTLTADDDVKAVVLRIDSGGGSARASELIWHAVSELAAKKPVVVSMSDVAASGGYYIAAGATRIYALDDTLTGSIGVVGGKLAPAAGLADLGVTTFPMGRGKRATMMASLGTWSPDERAVVQKSMDDVYGTFLERVAAGRKMTKEAVGKIAAGRVWTGADARRLGLVDEIGGIDAAMAEARKLGGLDDDTVVEVYPADPTLRDFVQSLGEVSLPWGLDSSWARLAAEISPDVARVVERTLRQLLLFRESRVLAVSIFPVVM